MCVLVFLSKRLFSALTGSFIIIGNYAGKWASQRHARIWFCLEEHESFFVIALYQFSVLDWGRFVGRTREICFLKRNQKTKADQETCGHEVTWGRFGTAWDLGTSRRPFSDHFISSSHLVEIETPSKPWIKVPWMNSAANITFPLSHLKLQDSNYNHWEEIKTLFKPALL